MAKQLECKATIEDIGEYNLHRVRISFTMGGKTWILKNWGEFSSCAVAENQIKKVCKKLGLKIIGEIALK